MVSGQEHSDVPYLWQRPNPDIVIALLVDLATIRRRRDDDRWPAWLLARQRHRLRQAIAAASIVIDASDQDEATVLMRAMHHLRQLASVG